MAKQSLFSACKRVFRDGISGTYTVGNNDIFLELYSQQDIDQNNEIGNSSEENIVVVAGDTITIPEGYTLTPVKPKKSLVVICNTFVNNGTVSMYQKAPNVLPHDLFIIEKNEFSGNKDVIISAYANNGRTNTFQMGEVVDTQLCDGGIGTDRQCGGGGLGSALHYSSMDDKSQAYGVKSGSGYAFGGGAGAGGIYLYTYNYREEAVLAATANQTYPCIPGNGYNYALGNNHVNSGVGNPKGSVVGGGAQRQNNFGCGGRIIIFCNSFENNGSITVNGTDSSLIIFDYNNSNGASGGASGAGAVDLFYTTLINQGTITANGGKGGKVLNSSSHYAYNYHNCYVGSGGDGSITLAPWTKSSVLKPISKYMSKENMVYFLTNYIQRLKQGED